MIKNEAYLDVSNEEQFENEILVTLDDNSDWEYTRLGFGEDHNGLYMVDLDDSGENLREKIYVNPGHSLMDIMYEGVARDIFEEYEDGSFAMNFNASEKDWLEFEAWMK